jgi:CCR4-NOT transcription complex subunit 1
MSLLVALLLSPSQYPIPPITGLLPASPSEPIWHNMITLLHIIWRMTSISPDAIPLFTMPGAPSLEAFARIVNPPPHDRVWSKAARQQATDIQGAGLWNTLGLIQILVHANALAEGEIGDLPSDERVEIGRMATERLDRAGLVAPELVLIALEKLPVSARSILPEYG